MQLSPSTCRHIFVVDRRTNQQLPGPADDDAAVAMGHSSKQWDLGIYDISKHTAAAQSAVNSMAAWRTALQQKQQCASNDGQHSGADEDEDEVYFSVSEDSE